MDIIWLNKNPVIPLHRGKSLRRRINSWITGLDYRLRLSAVHGYPRHLVVDLVNTCGLKCPICPQGRGEINRESCRISESFFQRLMDRLGPYLYTLTLTNWGEPTLHPDLSRLIRYARKFPCYIGFSSNLQFTRDAIIPELIESGVDEIGCSIDGVTEETYSRYRIGGSFQVALKNMIELVTSRNRAARRSPKIRWQVLLNRYTEKEIEPIIAKAHEIGVDSLVFVPIFIDIARMFTQTPAERMNRDKDWLPVDESLSWYDYRTGHLKQKTKLCSKLWDTLVLHSNGDVSPCCAVINPDDDFGRLTEAIDFRLIWNNEKFRTARKRMSHRLHHSVDVVCEHCYRHGVMIY